MIGPFVSTLKMPYPTASRAYMNRGVAYFVLGHLVKAIQDYDETIRLDFADASLTLIEREPTTFSPRTIRPRRMLTM